MSRYNYRGKLDERLAEIRRLYDNNAKPGEICYIGWKRESGVYSLYRVTNHFGGIRVLRSAGSASELLDFVEGFCDGTAAARMAAEVPGRDALMN